MQLLNARNSKAAASVCRRRFVTEHMEPDALHILGLAYHAAADVKGAREALIWAFTKKTERAAWWRDELGMAFRRFGNFPAAVDAFRESLRLHPKDEASMLMLARSLRDAGQDEDAQDAYEEVLRLFPKSLEARLALAGYLSEAGFFERALQHLRIAAAQSPGNAAVQRETGDACWAMGDLDAALAAYAKGLGQSRARLDSITLNALLFQPSETADSIRSACEKAARRLARGTKAHHPERKPRRNRRLRIGYVSSEFISGPAYFFIKPLIKYLDRSSFEVFCYHSRGEQDSRTREFQSACDHWRDISEMADDEACSLIARDEIDVLVELSGQFMDNRLAVFARRPAPVQFCFPVYPCTTGLKQIDYIFTDTFLHPPGAVEQYTERPWYLPSGALGYLPPASGAPVLPLPSRTNGHVTFGVFQQPGKFHDGVWDVWARILRRVSGSGILFHFGSAELENDRSATQRSIREKLGARGVQSSRILFRGLLPHEESLAIKGTVDIALDTFPFNGFTTTCESLWMGVPVVTLAGDRHASRVSYSVLARLGLHDWAACTPDDYVEIAVRKACCLDSLAKLRRKLRGKVREQLDPKRLAQEAGEAYLRAFDNLAAGARP